MNRQDKNTCGAGVPPVEQSVRGKSAKREREDWNYEVAVAKVEAIVARIEAGELELEEVFDQFAAAIEYLRQCETFLQERQQQVNLLIETLNDPQF